MLDFDFIDWDENGNVLHVAANGLTRDEVEDVLFDPHARPTLSRSTNRPAVTGVTSTGKTIFVVYERDEDAGSVVIRPVTAFEIKEP